MACHSDLWYFCTSANLSPKLFFIWAEWSGQLSHQHLRARRVCESSLPTVPLSSVGKQAALSTCLPSDTSHRQGTDTNLQDTHAKRVAQDLVGLVVVTVANVCGCYEELKGVILLYVQSSILYFLLQLPHPLFPMTTINPDEESQLHRKATVIGNRAHKDTCIPLRVLVQFLPPNFRSLLKQSLGDSRLDEPGSWVPAILRYKRPGSSSQFSQFLAQAHTSTGCWGRRRSEPLEGNIVSQIQKERVGSKVKAL